MKYDLIKYSDDMAGEWNRFVASSKNGTFLLHRLYLDDHKDRFPDRSVVIRDESGRIVALFPATSTGQGVLSSHGGLTYGGFVMGADTRAQQPLEWLELIAEYARQEGYNRIVYKCIPHIYHRVPAEEDIYALFGMGARLSVCNLASVVPLPGGIASRLGKRAAKRIARFGLAVEQASVAEIWPIIVEDRRVRHNTVPVHSLDEMELLASRFPENIKVFKTVAGGEILAGAVVYLMPETGVMHLQYAAASPEGFDIYAVDAIYHRLVTSLYPDYRWFDFGTSNEDGGRYLNTGMTAHKEEFGGRSVVYMQFAIDL